MTLILHKAVSNSSSIFLTSVSHFGPDHTAGFIALSFFFPSLCSSCTHPPWLRSLIWSFPHYMHKLSFLASLKAAQPLLHSPPPLCLLFSFSSYSSAAKKRTCKGGSHKLGFLFTSHGPGKPKGQTPVG